MSTKLSFLDRLANQMDKNAADEAMKKRIAAEARTDMANVIRQQEDSIGVLTNQLSTLDADISKLNSDLEIAMCPVVTAEGVSSFSAMKLVEIRNRIDKKTKEASKLVLKIKAAKEGLTWLKKVAEVLFTDLDVTDTDALLSKY